MMKPEALQTLVKSALEDLKAVDIISIDVGELTSVTDTMIFASGTSTRHVKSIASNVVQEAKAAKHPPFGVEGEEGGEWILIDLGDALVHIMLPEIRKFYAIEQLWSGPFKEVKELKA